MNLPARDTGDGGFTLLELLIAFFLLTIVLSAVYGSYAATFQTVQQAGSRADDNARARVALSRIVEDLQSLYLGGDGYFRGAQDDIGGHRADGLDFTSTAHLRFHPDQLPAGYAYIRYTTRKNAETGELQLSRSDIGYRPGVRRAGEGMVLCSGLAEVRFVYVDQDGARHDDWGSGFVRGGGAEVPVLVEITLRFPGEDDGGRGNVFTTAVSLMSWEKTGT